MQEEQKAPGAAEIGQLWFERVWGERDRSAIFDYIAPEGVAHLEGGRELTGPDAFAEFHDGMLSAFPGAQMELLGIVSQDDEVCVHWKFIGTHEGDGLGIPATGEPISFTGITRLVVKDGVIVEGWDTWNHGGVMARLGAPDEAIRSM